MILSLSAQRYVRFYDKNTGICHLNMPYLRKHFRNCVIYKKVRSNTTYYLRKLDLRKGFNTKSFLFELMITGEEATGLIMSCALVKVCDPLKKETDVFYYLKQDVEHKINECKCEIKLLESDLESAREKLRFWEGVV